MKLYVCYGTWTVGKPVHAHPCGEAHKALIEAGYRPEVVLSYGLGPLPRVINDLFAGRREVREATGSPWVPLLVLGDGTTIQGSHRIIRWAQANLADAPAVAASAAPVA